MTLAHTPRRRPRSVLAVVSVLAGAVVLLGPGAPAEARLPECPQQFDDPYAQHQYLIDDCNTSTPPPPPPPPPNPYGFNAVLTLGDSFASGTGRHIKGSSHDQEHGGLENGLKLTGRSDNECWREWHDTPGPRVAATYGSANYFLACKGAETAHVRNQLTVANQRYPHKANAGWSNTLMVVVAGGNDLRAGTQTWPDIIQKCVLGVATCASHENHPSNYAVVQDRLANLYLQMANQAPNARVRVLGYPLLMKPGSSSCTSVTGVSATEARWIDERVGYLNNNVATAVARVKASRPNFDIRFVPVTNHFVDGSCSSSGWNKADVNDRVVEGLFKPTSDASFHPSLRGYGRYEQALRANL